jgi:hypothetical protein
VRKQEDVGENRRVIRELSLWHKSQPMKPILHRQTWNQPIIEVYWMLLSTKINDHTTKIQAGDCGAHQNIQKHPIAATLNLNFLVCEPVEGAGAPRGQSVFSKNNARKLGVLGWSTNKFTSLALLIKQI